MNFDRSRRNGSATARGVIHDDQEKCMKGYMFNFCKISRNEVEAMGLIQGLETTIDLSVPKLVIQGDSLIAIEVTNGEQNMS